MHEKSKGHILFRDEWEYYEYGGEVFRVKIGDPFDKGYRMGARWECSVSHFKRMEESGIYPFDSKLPQQ